MSTHNEILFNLMNNPVACYNMDEPEDIRLREISSYNKTNTLSFCLPGLAKVVKSIETESRMVITRDWRGYRERKVVV